MHLYVPWQKTRPSPKAQQHEHHFLSSSLFLFSMTQGGSPIENYIEEFPWTQPLGAMEWCHNENCRLKWNGWPFVASGTSGRCNVYSGTISRLCVVVKWYVPHCWWGGRRCHFHLVAITAVHLSHSSTRVFVHQVTTHNGTPSKSFTFFSHASSRFTSPFLSRSHANPQMNP